MPQGQVKHMSKRRRQVLLLTGAILAVFAFFFVESDVLLKLVIYATAVLAVLLLLSGAISLLRKQRIRSGEEYIKEELENTAKKKLEGISGSFKKLAASFESLTQSKEALNVMDMNAVFEGLSSNLCENCTKCSICWQKHFDESYEAACSVLEAARENGAVGMEDVPIHLKKHCIRVEDFIEETNRNMSLAKLKLAWHNRMAESREAVAGQLGEVARIVKEFSNNLCDTGEIIEIQRKKVTRKLGRHDVKVARVMMFERENRGAELHLTAKCREGRCITTKEAAVLLGQALDKKFIPREDSRNVIGKNYADYVFCEDANFKVLTGVARAAKKKGEVSGDNFSFLYPDSFDVVMMLSDGMGTGEEANRDSEMVIELLEEFLEAGFREEIAVRLINSILVLRSEQEMFSTVDLCVINLCAATCEFVKIGAATTFIKRNQYVETIQSTSLPPGMLNKVDYETQCKKLYEGDYVIMVSDGVLDCVEEEDKEAYLTELIAGFSYQNPQELANAILSKALEQHGFEPVDDMTVLVTGIWKK